MPKPRWMPLPKLLYAQLMSHLVLRRNLRLADQYGVCGAAQSEPAPAGGRDPAARCHVMQE
jgi:hypothetical protein